MKKDELFEGVLKYFTDWVNSENSLPKAFVKEFNEKAGSIKDVSGIYYLIHKHIPADDDSFAFSNCDRIIRQNYFKKKYPDEYIFAVNKYNYRYTDKLREANQQRRLDRYKDLNGEILNYDKSNPPINIISNDTVEYGFYPRWMVEWNPNFVQFSVSAIVRTMDDKYIILKCIHGILDGKYTMIQGHCAYDMRSFIYTKDFSIENLVKYSINEIYREIEEEVGIERKFIAGPALESKYNITSPVAYIAPVYDEIANVSFYHNGLSFLLSTSLTSEDILALPNPEPEKHDICVMTAEEIHTLRNSDTCDHWLDRALEAFASVIPKY